MKYTATFHPLRIDRNRVEPVPPKGPQQYDVSEFMNSAVPEWELKFWLTGETDNSSLARLKVTPEWIRAWDAPYMITVSETA